PTWDGEVSECRSCVANLRGKLSRFGVRIHTVRGQGWRLLPDQQEAVRDACTADRPVHIATVESGPEGDRLLALLRKRPPASVAEISCALDLPYGRARELTAGLVAAGRLERVRPAVARAPWVYRLPTPQRAAA